MAGAALKRLMAEYKRKKATELVCILALNIS